MTEVNKQRAKTWAKATFKYTLKYFVARLIISVLSLIICGISYYFIGIPLWLLMAAVVGISSLIPMFGAWIAALVVGIVSWCMADFKTAIWALLVLIVLQVIEEFILEPLVMGRSMDIKPLIIFGATFVIGGIFGFWGIVFAVPIAAAVKLGYQIFYLKEDISKSN